MAENGNVDWHLRGEGVTTCNCAWGCPCQFNALPTHGNCEAVAAWQINEGHFGDVSLDGTRFAWIVYWPGAIHEGGGTWQVVVDEAASDEQREALVALHSGAHGGTGFEIFNAVCDDKRDPISAPISFDSDRERRVASFRVGEIAETRVEPITNPVDGTEHRARIDLPEGFEYHLAEMGNSVAGRASAGAPLDLSFENTYAQLNEIDWAPA